MSRVFIDRNNNNILENNDFVQEWDHGRQVSQRTVEQYLRQGSEAQRFNPSTELSRIVQNSGWRVSAPLQARVNQLTQAYQQRERAQRVSGAGGYGGMGVGGAGWGGGSCSEGMPSHAQGVRYFDPNRNGVADPSDRVEVGIRSQLLRGSDSPVLGRRDLQRYSEYEEYYQNISLDYYLTQTTYPYDCGDRQGDFRMQVEGTGIEGRPLGGTPFNSISPALNHRMRGEPAASTVTPAASVSRAPITPTVARPARPAPTGQANPPQNTTHRSPDAGVTPRPPDAGVNSNPQVIIVQQPYPVYVSRDPAPATATPSDASSTPAPRGREVIEGATRDGGR